MPSGYSATLHEVIGKPVTILIPSDRIDEEPEILRRIGRGERIDHFDTVRRRKDGGLIDISLTVSPLKDADGRVVGAPKSPGTLPSENELRSDRSWSSVK